MRFQAAVCAAVRPSPLLHTAPHAAGATRHHAGIAAAQACRRGAAARARAEGGGSHEQLERSLAWQLEERGLHDGEGPDVSGLADAVVWLQGQGVRKSTAVQLVLQHDHLLASADPEEALGPKFALFQRHCCAEAGWAEALARALQASPDGEALTLPLPAFEAALQFAAAQLQRLSRRRYEQLLRPYSLHRLVKLHPEAAGGLLSQHPDAFATHASPWLAKQLGWDAAALADAALSPWMPDLCRLDQQHGGACLGWLTSLGLSQQQAGQLLRHDVRLLAAGPGWEVHGARRRVAELAAAWGSSPCLAAALLLSQPWLTAGMAERTGRLVGTLQEYAGMREGQLVAFALAGGFDGGSFTRTDAGLRRATDRLKQLLMVYGGWPQVAAALERHPEALSMSWHGVGSLLDLPQQRAAWRTVAAIDTPAEAK